MTADDAHRFARMARCPECGSAAVKVLSMFGTGLSDASMRCDRCKTVFPWIRVGDDDTQGDPT